MYIHICGSNFCSARISHEDSKTWIPSKSPIVWLQNYGNPGS